jgi:prepilin-type N-terminal cleavage/methylation domain-containing protein
MMANQRGFTLAELLVAMAILALILGGVFTLQQEGLNAYLFGAARAETQQKVRVALERMTRDLRTGSAVTVAANCNTGANDITFTFVDDTQTTVTVRYYLNGISLMRNQTNPVVAGQPETVIGDVQAMTILCYDANANATATVVNVRSVEVNLTTQIEDVAAPGGQSPANQTAIMTTRVRMRNI